MRLREHRKVQQKITLNERSTPLDALSEGLYRSRVGFVDTHTNGMHHSARNVYTNLLLRTPPDQ